MIEETTLWQTTATSAPGTVRWKSPELLKGDQKTVTIHSDMYAYGMTCLVSYKEPRISTGGSYSQLIIRKYTRDGCPSMNTGMNGW